MRSGIGNSASDPVFVSVAGASGGTNPAGSSADPSYSRVQGTQANGATTTADPVLVAGTDTNGATRRLRTGTGGQAVVAVGQVSAGGAALVAQTNVIEDNAGTGRALAVASYVFDGGNNQPLRAGPTAAARLASSAGTTNPTLGSAAARVFYGGTLQNTNAAARYLKIYDKASAPTVGTDTPIWVEYLPPSAKTVLLLPTPLRIVNGLAYAITTGVADNDTGVVTAGDIIALNLGYSA